MSERIPILICAIHPSPGAQRLNCQFCDRYVYEDPVNVRLVKTYSKYFIVCMLCAAKAKREMPNFPAIEGQLWEGKVRDVQDVIEPYKPLVDFLAQPNPSQVVNTPAVPPHEVIREYMRHHELTIKTLAEKMIAPQYLAQQLYNGEIRIDFLIASALADVFKRPASFWLRLQYQYDESLRRK